MPTLAELGWSPFFSAQDLPSEKPDFFPARVVAHHGALYVLADDRGTWPSQPAGKLRHRAESEAELPVIGDWVLAKAAPGGQAVIQEILPRRSLLSRRRPHDRNSPGVPSPAQVLAANLDLVFLVSSLNQDFSPARIERGLVMVWDSGAVPVVLLSKSDLPEDGEAAAETVRAGCPGVDVHCCSSVTGHGLDAIRAHFRPGLTACLLGSSGVGKSTLLNLLCGTEQKTLEVRADDGRGRHATTARELFFLPGGGMLIDTPGLREFGLTGDAGGLSAVFGDIESLARACRFADCRHREEPGCAVKQAVADGDLSAERLAHFHKLHKELEYQAGKYDPARQQEQKRRDKHLGRLVKDVNRRRRERYQE